MSSLLVCQFPWDKYRQQAAKSLSYSTSWEVGLSGGGGPNSTAKKVFQAYCLVILWLPLSYSSGCVHIVVELNALPLRKRQKTQATLATEAAHAF